MSRHEQSDPGLTPSGRNRVGHAALTVVLTIALVCGAVVAVVLWRAAADTDRAVAAHRHQVKATTTGPAKEPPLAARHGGKPQTVAPAVWEYPDDIRRSGTVPVPPRTPQGRGVTIWVDDDGTPAQPPGSAADRALVSLAGGIAVAGAAGAAGQGALSLVRRRAEGRVLGAWEREWEQVEPLWSGRLRRGNAPGADD
ncbi:hypothetical protein ACFY8W_02620 [Streptomyces sp. NPDC012637]|uniref:Rv1733c family protein n=1 Tax=Streptomyces sp. NPDC012637 TaxID=3364842 RepID=UPI0036E04C74